MAKKVYAYTGMVSRPYLTAGKRYEVVDEAFDGLAFRAFSEIGHLGFFLWQGCAHLEGGNWTREEVEETP